MTPTGSRSTTTVSTAPDQIAMAPGYLEREWTENGRRYFRYVMDKPILGFYSLLSARYSVKRRSYNGVARDLLPSRAHLRARVDAPGARRTGSTTSAPTSAPYQYRQYRILEFPRYAGFAQAFPNTIPFSEGIGFLMRNEGGDDDDRHRLLRDGARAGPPVVGAPGGRRPMHRARRSSPRGSRSTPRSRSWRSATAARPRRNSCAANSMATCGGGASSGRRKCRSCTSRTSRTSTTRRARSSIYALRDYIGEEAMNRGAAQLPGEVGVQGAAVPDGAGPLRGTGRRHARLAQVRADGPLRGDHPVRQQGGVGHVQQAARREV